MRITVLGCGPAGLMAAHAVMMIGSEWGFEPDLAIFSRKVKSPLYGAQYLHRPIPGINCGEPRLVEYMLRGNPEDYKRKVYGSFWDGTVSPEDLGQQHRAWDIRAAYDDLWDAYHRRINDVELDAGGVVILKEQHSDVTINTIPRPAICYQGHAFSSTDITAAGDAPDLGITLAQSGYTCLDDTVICNGEESPSWYRMSRVFGHTTIEWPGKIDRVPINTAARVRKPLHHNCDCHDDIIHVGRYGEWSKGVLSHTAYFNTYRELQRRMVPSEAAQGTLW